MNLDEIESKRMKLDRQLRKLKNDKNNINFEISELEDDIQNLEQEELSQFRGREITTDSWRYVRTESNPDKANWWNVVKNTDQGPAKVAAVLQSIDESLVTVQPKVSAIKNMIASGRLIIREGGKVIDPETGLVLPYIARQKPDKLTVKAVE
ncbi:chromosome segregation protein SMC [Pediococcus argentinicus]|uniref:chromosome segregation protein SMC n=1 Tax=Pediococcus argentinicus TaxID=480391 RepID=UPI00338EFAA0